MSSYFNQILISSEADGTAYASSTTPTSIIPTGAVWTMPANYADIGKTITLDAYGKISTTATPTITFSVYLAGATFAASQAITTGSGITNLTWNLHLDITFRAIGSGTSANAMFSGYVIGPSGAGLVTMIPATSPAVSSGFNSTSANAVDLYATWSANSASNTLTCNGYKLTGPAS